MVYPKTFCNYIAIRLTGKLKKSFSVGVFMIFRKITALSRSLHRKFNEIIKDTGLGSGQVFILMTLVENPGINQDLLCRILELDKSTVTKGIKTLLKEKYIIRVRDKNDMRNWIIFPSKHGEVIYHDLKKYAEDFEKQITADIANSEIIQLSEILNILSKNTLF